MKSPGCRGFANINNPPVVESSRRMPRSDPAPSARIATRTDPSTFTRVARWFECGCGKCVIAADYFSPKGRVHEITQGRGRGICELTKPSDTHPAGFRQTQKVDECKG